MIRHIVIAALRNLAANRLVSAIAILGLSAGIAVALLAALVIRSQFDFNRFIPGHERTYLTTSVMTVPGRGTFHNEATTSDTGALLALHLPGIESMTRVMTARDGNARMLDSETLPFQHGVVSGREAVTWADPNLASVLPLPVFRGDLRTALARPDGIVLPRAIARKYFGRDDIVGEQILMNRQPMTVRAVIEDLPPHQSELESGIFASGLASFSGFAEKLDPGSFNTNTRTYVRLKSGASRAAAQSALPGIVERLLRRAGGGETFPYALALTPIASLNLDNDLHPGVRTRLAVEGLVGFLILFVAAVNFVNLLTARAVRRAREVGMRKACGAGRRHLMIQFLGEAILTVALSAALAAALCEWLLPGANAFLGTAAGFDPVRDPALLPALVLAVLLLGLAAGAWPAFVLSTFRPVRTLKDSSGDSDGAGLVRKVLTGLQFAILTVLITATIIVWQQHLYATRDALRANTARMLMLRGVSCTPAFRAEIRKLPGVEALSCSDNNLLHNSMMGGFSFRGAPAQVDVINADWGLFALYGIKPLAGALATTSPLGDFDSDAQPAVVLNSLAVRKLGFASPGAAIGQRVTRFDKSTARIVAVVPDFAFYSVERALEPTIYAPMPAKATLEQRRSLMDRNKDGVIDKTDFGALSAPFPEEADTDHDGRIDLAELGAATEGNGNDLASIKLRGETIPESLAAIDRLWPAIGNRQPIDRFFLDARIQELYVDMVRQAQLLGLFAGVAVLLACLGLFGIAVSTAERRTKEIGVRKAMGAKNRQIVALLLWQFAQPVLWANLIAWPAAWWLMRRWLSGFAYHVELQWWVFAAASLAALLIALATVAGQAFLTARQKPVLALRYE